MGFVRACATSSVFFWGNNLVVFAVISGLAALILVNPVIRIVLFALSTLYLVYLAARIALAGTKIRFIEAQGQPGVMAGLLLQPINPKAYVVNATLFSGFQFLPDAYWTEAALKVLFLNAIWIPIHLAWLYAGVWLERLDLPDHIQRRINIAMAAAMLGVVAIATLSATL